MTLNIVKSVFIILILNVVKCILESKFTSLLFRCLTRLNYEWFIISSDLSPKHHNIRRCGLIDRALLKVVMSLVGPMRPYVLTLTHNHEAGVVRVVLRFIVLGWYVSFQKWLLSLGIIIIFLHLLDITVV